jgi:hypothetical protein
LTDTYYNPSSDGTLEHYIGNLNYIFVQLDVAGNPLSEVNKLGVLRSALKKGSKKFDQTLHLCEFTSKTFQETLDKLHELEIKTRMDDFADKPSRINKRKSEESSNNTYEHKNKSNNNNRSNNYEPTCNYCGKKGHKQPDCKQKANDIANNRLKKCDICGKDNHQTSKCFQKPNNANNVNESNKNKSSNNRKPKQMNNNKYKAKKAGLKEQFKSKVSESNNIEESDNEESNMIFEFDNRSDTNDS